MGTFSADEIYQFAIRIEENGGKFYRYAAENATDAKIKKVLGYMADEELKHRDKFKHMLSEIHDYEPEQSYPQEYFAYIRSYADHVLFSGERMGGELDVVKDVVSALDFGIQRELDSILYYQEIKNLVPQKQHGSIEGIISEERRHFTQLGDLKKSVR